MRWGFVKEKENSKQTPEKVELAQKSEKIVQIKSNMQEKDTKTVQDWKTDAMHFIADFEWFRSCAYNDSKQWSIGYGTRSHPWECITKEEAMQRKKTHLNPLYELVDKTCYTDNQKIALVSYMYNVWRYAMRIDSYIEKCDHKNIKFIMNTYGWTIKGKWSNGLAKRRNIEINKFNQ